MVTRLSAAIIFFFQFFVMVRVLSDVPAQSAGDLVDGLSKAEEEVFSFPKLTRKEYDIAHWTHHGPTMNDAMISLLFPNSKILFPRQCEQILRCLFHLAMGALSAQGCSYAHYFGHASHAAFEPGYRWVCDLWRAYERFQ